MSSQMAQCCESILRTADMTYTKQRQLCCPCIRSCTDFSSRSADEKFIFKRVPTSFFKLSQRIANDFPMSSRLRMHVDSNTQESTLVYPYFRDTLLALLEDDADFPPTRGSRSCGELERQSRTFIQRIGSIPVLLLSIDWRYVTDVLPKISSPTTS